MYHITRAILQILNFPVGELVARSKEKCLSLLKLTIILSILKCLIFF